MTRLPRKIITPPVPKPKPLARLTNRVLVRPVRALVNLIAPLIRSGMNALVAKVKKRPWILLLLIGLFPLLLTRLDLAGTVLWTVFLLFLLYGFDSRIIAAAALGFLVSCPVLLQLKQDARAEQMAVYAYFLLVMTVALQIVEYKRDGGEEPSP